MRKLLVVFLLLGLCLPAKADEVWVSSFSSQAQSTGTIKTGRAVIHGVLVGAAGVASSMSIWDGITSFTYISKIASLTTTSVIYFPMDVNIVSGVVVQRFGTSPAGITILYK